MAGHTAGDPIECYGIPVVIHKIPQLSGLGQPMYDPEGKQVYLSGFRVGGGIDQDPTRSPQGYPDKGVYVTYIYDGGPAQKAGLQIHDKLLQVNGHDLTITTHKKAVEYIGRKPVLNLLVYRKGMPSLQQQSYPLQQHSYQQQHNYQQQPQSRLQQNGHQQHHQPAAAQSPNNAQYQRPY